MVTVADWLIDMWLKLVKNCRLETRGASVDKILVQTSESDSSSSRGKIRYAIMQVICSLK